MIGIRRRLVIGLAFVLAGALARIGIFPTTEPAEASPREGSRSQGALRRSEYVPPNPITLGRPNVLDWNMCGGVACESTDMYHPWNTLIHYTEVASPLPTAITLQEVCQPQMESLNYWLTQLGYTGAKYWSNENPSPECDNHGNAVFWQGGAARFDTGRYPAAMQADEADKRGWVCGQAQTPLYIACSTHLTHIKVDGIPIIARQQVTEFRKMLDWKNANKGPTYGAGDFNMVWDDFKSEFLGRYADSAPGPGRHTYHAENLPPNTGTGLKIKYDYIQVPGPDVPALKAPIHWCISSWPGEFQNVWRGPLAPNDKTSDHLMHWGYANLC